MGPPGPADEVGQRQQDGDEDADQDPEQGDAQEGGQPEDELGAADPPQAPDRGHVDQADGRGDDDRGQHRQGQVAQGAGRDHQQQGDGDGPDQRRELGAGPGGHGHRGPRRARGDGEALEQAGGQVGGAQSPQLLVGVDGLVALGGQGLRQDGGVGHRDQGDADGPAEQRPQVGQVDPRQGQGGEALGEHADDLDPLRLEVEQGHGGDADDHGHHDPGDLGPQPAQDQDDHDAGQPDGQGGPVDPPVGHSLDDVPGLGEQPAALDGEAAQLGELPDQDGDGDAVQVAGLHRPRQQLGHEPQPGQAGDQDDQAGEDGQGAGQGDRRLGVVAAQGQDHGRDHRGQRRVGPEHHHPRRPKDGVDDQGHDGGVQPGDRGQAGRLGVAHAHRDQQGGQDQPGHQVAAQPGAPVLAQGAQPRHPPLGAARPPTAHRCQRTTPPPLLS
jgi:hypothetical protein